MWILPPARIWSWGGTALLLKRLGVSSSPLFKTNHIPCQVWQWVSCWSPSPVKQPVVSLKTFFWSSRSHFLLFCPCFCHVIFLFCPWGEKVYACDHMGSRFVDLLWQWISNCTCLTYLTVCFLFLLLQLFTQSRLLYLFTLTAAPPCGSWRHTAHCLLFRSIQNQDPNLILKTPEKLAYFLQFTRSLDDMNTYYVIYIIIYSEFWTFNCKR